MALIVATPNVSNEIVSLTTGAPAATGKDIVVVDPTTAGVSLPGNDLDLNVAALGLFITASNTCTLGGSAMGKSAMMPPYGRALSAEEIRSVIAFTRAIAQPPYQPPGRPGSQYSAK